MKEPKFDFLSSSRFISVISLALCIVGVIWITSNGLNYGIDFSGGNEVQIRFQSPPKVEELRSYVSSKGFSKPSVQSFGKQGNEFLIFIENIPEKEEKINKAKKINEGKRINEGSNTNNTDNTNNTNNTNNTDKTNEQDISETRSISKVEKLINSLQSDYAKQGAEIRKVNSVGPQIGSELRKKGFLAIFYSLIMILVYLAIRFDYKFAPAAVICLFHDAVLTMWVFSLFNLVVSVQTLAALLAIIGYSLNDTIVTFDRIRENSEYFGRKESFLKLCNRSINDVLSRTLLTSITTLVSVGVMWFYTDGVIKDFAFTLGVGVFIGTYSSIYVATPLVVYITHLQKKRKLKASR